MTTAATINVLDPSGTVRATLASPASFRAILGAAWGLAEGDSLQVVAIGPDRWALMTFRPGHVPVCTPTGVESGRIAPGTVDAVVDGMCEVAWCELLEEGWRVEQSSPDGHDA